MRNGRILVLSGNRVVRTCVHLILMASTRHHIKTTDWDRPGVPALTAYDLAILDVSDPAHLPTRQPAATSTICMVPPDIYGQDLPGMNGAIYFSSASDAVQLLKLVELELARVQETLPLAPRPPTGLTVKEEGLLRLVAKGLSNRRIALELAIAEPTVRVHKHHVMRKLGIHSSVQLYQFACGLEEEGWTGLH